MISVPEAGLFPMTPRPVSSSKRRTIQSGKPSGYVGNGSSRIKPIISQWPASVALAADSSTMSPCEAPGEPSGGTPSISVTLPRPSLRRLGRSRPPTAFAVLPRVLAPSSPKSAASGASPTPTPSRTTTTVLRSMLLLFSADRRTSDRGAGASPYPFLLWLCVLERKTCPPDYILAGPDAPDHQCCDRVTAGEERKDTLAELRVRQATAEDAEMVHSLAGELAGAVGDSPPDFGGVEVRLAELLDESRARVLVAEDDDGAVVGAASLWIKPDLAHGDTVIEVPMLVVSEQ